LSGGGGKAPARRSETDRVRGGTPGDGSKTAAPGSSSERPRGPVFSPRNTNGMRLASRPSPPSSDGRASSPTGIPRRGKGRDAGDDGDFDGENVGGDDGGNRDGPPGRRRRRHRNDREIDDRRASRPSPRSRDNGRRSRFVLVSSLDRSIDRSGEARRIDRPDRRLSRRTKTTRCTELGNGVGLFSRSLARARWAGRTFFFFGRSYRRGTRVFEQTNHSSFIFFYNFVWCASNRTRCSGC